MGLIADIKTIINGLLPDNSSQAISAEDARLAFDAVLDNLDNVGSNYYGTKIPTDAAIAGVEEGATVLPLEDGTYTNYGGLIRNNELCVFVYESATWVKKLIKKDDLLTPLDVENLKSESLAYLNTSGVNEVIDGYYFLANGSLIASGLYKSVKFEVDDYKEYYATSIVSGDSTALAVYFDANGDWISYEYQGTNALNEEFNKFKLTLPEGTKFIGLSSKDTEYATLHEGVLSKIGITSNKVNKNMVWFGTSIPAFGYPLVVGEKLGANMVNEALGESMVRAFTWEGTFVGLNFNNCLKSLSQTFAEKQFIMDYWETGLDADGTIGPGGFGWRDLLTGSPPADYTTFASTEEILSWSYEHMLVDKYLNTADVDFIMSPDVFIFDHGHNDIGNISNDESYESSYAIPAIRNDRGTFIGAMTYIIDVILSYNPRARIVFSGHYENDRKTNISLAQINLSEYWDFPLIKLWEKLGWTQQEVTDNSYWIDGLNWSPSGGALTTKTLTQIWMNDNLHPASEPAKELIASNIAPEMNNNF